MMAKRSNSKIVELGPSVWLAAFGKHPGWNDHIDDLGIETDRLVAIKRQLYVDGIRKVIDGGLWDALKPEQHAEGFGHSFLWRSYDGLAVGRMWSSTDGKGRGRYPMIVCCQTHGASMDTIGSVVLPRLKQLEADCVGVGNAAAVIRLVDEARAELGASVGGAKPVSDGALAPPSALAEIAADPPGGVGEAGVTRVLYQIEREFSAYVMADGKSGSASRSRTLDVRPQQMRLPALRGDEPKVWSLWGRALLTRFDPLTSMLLVTRDGEDWLDVIVGEPGPAQLVCLQATVEGVPLTTDIPYVIDDAFAAGARELIASAASGEIVDQDLGYIAAPKDRIAALSRGLSRRNAEDVDTPDRRPLVLGAAAALVVLAVVIAAIMLIRGGSGGPEDVAQDETPEPVTGDADGENGVIADAPIAAPADVADAFARWCAAADGWFLGVASMSDVEGPGAAYVRESVLGPIESASAEGVVLDPRKWVANAPPSRKRLADLARSANPPEELLAPDAGEEIRRALRVIDATRSAISPRAWPAAADLERIAVRCASAGLEAQTAAVRTVLTGLSSDDQTEVVDAVRAVALLAGEAERVTTAINGIESARDSISGSGDAVLAAFPAYAADQIESALGLIGAPGDLRTVADRLEPLASLAGDLGRAADEQWPLVDAEAFAARSPVHAAFASAGGSATAETFDAWLAQVGSPEYRQIDPTLDPRRSAGLGGAIERMRGEADILREMLPASAGEVMATIDGDISQLAAEVDTLSAIPWNRSNEQRVNEATSAWLSSGRELLQRISGLRRDAIAGAEDRLREMRARDRVSSAGFARIDDTWRARRDEIIAAYESDGDVEALHNRAVELEAFLAGLEAAVAEEPDAASAGIDGEALGGVVRSLRERVIDGTIAGTPWTGTGYVETAMRLEAASREFAGLLGDLNRKLADGALLAERVAAYGQLDTERDGETLDALASRVEASDEAGVFAPVLADVAALRELAAETDAAALRSRARASGGSGGAALAAWLRLGEIEGGAWPASAADLRQDAEIASRVRQRIRADLPEDQADMLAAEVRRESTRRWHALASRADDAETWRELARRAESFDVDADALTPKASWSMALARLGDAADTAGGDEAALRSAIATAAASMTAPADASEASAWLQSARALVSGEPEQAPPLNPAQLGPGRVGWRVVEQSDARVVYSGSANGEEIRIAFRLVRPADTDPFYLAEAEASVGVLLAALASPGGETVRATLPGPWPSNVDPRRGPRTWSWGGQGNAREVAVADEWIADSPGRIDPYYAPSIRDSIGEPRVDHPVNRVSPVTALYVARALGCRLPSNQEWVAAHAVGGSGSEVNRRDGTWLAQHAYMSEVESSGRSPDWPDVGILTPGRYRAGGDTQVVSGSDGVLWFAGADAGSGPFSHLVGNVAEWTAAYSGQGEAVRGDVPGTGVVPSPEQVGAWIPSGDAGLRVGVIGASALSPVSIEPAEPFEHPSRPVRPDGYADVGFRLAFSLAGQSAAKPFAARARELIDRAPYLRGRDN